MPVELWDNNNLWVNSAFADSLRRAGLNSAAAVWRLRGETVKKTVRERGTERVRLPLADGRTVEAYLKRYHPVGGREKIKCWLSLKPALYDAGGEWRALVAFQKLAIPSLTPIAAGRVGRNSFSLTLGLTNSVRLSDLFASHTTGVSARRRLIVETAELVGRMHSAGFVHQDCYLVHLFVDRDLAGPVRIIDLQRAFPWRGRGRRWRAKDLAQLLFSAAPVLGQTDVMRFWRTYREIAGIAADDRHWPRKIMAKAGRISRHHARNHSGCPALK